MSNHDIFRVMKIEYFYDSFKSVNEAINLRGHQYARKGILVAIQIDDSVSWRPKEAVWIWALRYGRSSGELRLGYSWLERKEPVSRNWGRPYRESRDFHVEVGFKCDDARRAIE